MDIGFGMGDMIFQFLFLAVFVLIFAVIVVTFVRGIGEWNKNNHSPRLAVEATVVAKRTDVTYHEHGNMGDQTGAHGYHTTSSNTYYVTFEVKSGDRMEFCVGAREYGMLVERDFGELTFQGTRYIGFERR